MELIKTTIKVGNSAGVILPKEYLNSQVKIILEPLNIEKDVLNILLDENILRSVKGVYLIGSYAREEQDIESDVDVLVITTDLNKRIIKNKYELICISEKELKEQLGKNALPILPMIKEAKTIINKGLIKKYIDSPLTKKNLRWHIDTSKSAIEFIEKDLENSKKLDEKTTGNEIAYSLILRLRTLYTIDCLNKNKINKKRDFLKLIKGITNSLDSYEIYLKHKSNQKSKKKLSINQAEKLVDYINKKLEMFKNG